MSTHSNPKTIGGFFQLELPHGEMQYHRKAVALSTGRSCLCAILRYLRPRRCLLPYYICAPAIDPFRKCGVDVEFYEVTDALTPVVDPKIGPDDLFLYVNYFGIKRDEVERLVSVYGERMIVDDTHDFFYNRGYQHAWSFTSARKYFGVPDGAFLTIPDGVRTEDVVPPETPAFADIELQHGLKRLTGHHQQAFGLFRKYEARLPCDLYRISDYSRCILSHVDYVQARDARRKNFQVLSNALDGSNCLRAAFPAQAVPYAYPLLPARPVDRQQFFDRKIYVPTLWPTLPQCDGSDFPMSHHLSQHILPLPVDHRYGEDDMMRVATAATEFLQDSR